MRVCAFALAAAAATATTCAAPAAVAVAEAGRWGGAEVVPGVSALSGGGFSTLRGFSCPAVGDCTAIGEFIALGSGGPISVGFIVSQSCGTWGDAKLIPGLPGGIFVSVNALSCAAPGNCVVGGYYQAGSATTDDQAFIAAESGGNGATRRSCPA